VPKTTSRKKIKKKTEEVFAEFNWFAQTGKIIQKKTHRQGGAFLILLPVTYILNG